MSKGLCFLTWNELRERSFKSRQVLGKGFARHATSAASCLWKGLPFQAEDAAATALTDLEQKARDKVTMVEAQGSSQTCGCSVVGGKGLDRRLSSTHTFDSIVHAKCRTNMLMEQNHTHLPSLPTWGLLPDSASGPIKGGLTHNTQLGRPGSSPKVALRDALFFPALRLSRVGAKLVCDGINVLSVLFFQHTHRSCFTHRLNR